MANNKISKAFESATAWAPTPAIYQEYKFYAATLDRLVEAAREFSIRAERQIYPSDKPNSDYAKLAELTAALRDIELPKGLKTSDANPTPS